MIKIFSTILILTALPKQLGAKEVSSGRMFLHTLEETKTDFTLRLKKDYPDIYHFLENLENSSQTEERVDQANLLKEFYPNTIKTFHDKEKEEINVWSTLKFTYPNADKFWAWCISNNPKEKLEITILDLHIGRKEASTLNWSRQIDILISFIYPAADSSEESPGYSQINFYATTRKNTNLFP